MSAGAPVQFLYMAVASLAWGCASLPATGSHSPGAGLPDAERPVGAATPGVDSPLDPAAAAWVLRTLASLSLREKVGQLVMPWVGGEYAAIGSPEFEQVRRWVEEDSVGGLVLSIGSPLAYAMKTNELQRRARVPLLIASDMENGPGMRLAGMYAIPSLLSQGGGTVFPPVMGIGATGSEELAFALGRVLGREARAVGVHLVFGPVLDVNSNPLNPIINTRSFGEDPRLVALLGAAYIRGARSEGLMTTAKHFPGHGDTREDSHILLPVIPADRARLDTVELPPFRQAIAEGIDAVMTAHVAVVGVEGPDAPPATLSPRFMTGILRDELRFSGLLFTDAMTMGAVRTRYGASEPLILALEAGADILLMPRDVTQAITTIMEAVRAGRLTEERIDSSVRRLLEMKARAGLHVGRQVDVAAIPRIVNVPEHAAVARDAAAGSIVLARDVRRHVPLIDSVRRILAITYAETAQLIAGRTFDRELRALGYTVESARLDDRTTAAEYAALRARAGSFDLTVVSAYVQPRDHSGAISAGGDVIAFVNEISIATTPLVVVSFGSPYLLTAFPSVSSYLLAWGGAPLSQQAAARALAGFAPITGTLPVSLPPHRRLGDGERREAVRAVPE